MQVTPLHQFPAPQQEAIARGEGYTMCPACGGGSSKKITLGLVYNEAVVYGQCFRATCGAKYLTVTDPSATFDRKKVKEARIFDKPTIPVQGSALMYLIVDYGLDTRTFDPHGWRITEHGEDYVMPVLDPYGRERGHITRSVDATPKRVFTYKATAQSFIDWWFDDKNSAPVVIVEDCLSACRLAGQGYNSVALLGTNISQKDAREIQETARDRDIVLALDRDAFDKAVKLSIRHRSIWGQIRMVCLDEDIKNMTDDAAIRELIDGRKADTSSDNTEQESL